MDLLLRKRIVRISSAEVGIALCLHMLDIGDIVKRLSMTNAFHIVGMGDIVESNDDRVNLARLNEL